MNAMFSGFRHELKHAMRQLQRRFGYSALTVAVLACGLGATMYVLVAINTLVIEPLPLPNSDRLVTIGSVDQDRPDRINDLPSQDYLDLRKQLTSYERFAAYYEATINLADAAEAQRYDGIFVAGELFEQLGERAMLGRVLTAADDVPGAVPAVVIGETVWRDRFGADPAIIGRSIRMNAQPATIVGVTAAPFAFPRQAQVWVSARFVDGTPEDNQFYGQIVGLLKPGISLDAAAAELAGVYPRLRSANMALRDDLHVGLMLMSKSFINSDTRQILMVMLVTAFSVLLLACANVANLQLGALAARSREFAVRAALGAGRGRIILGVLCESLMISLLATVIALAIADAAGAWTASYFARAGDSMGYMFSMRINERVVAMGAVIALLTTLLSGLVPAMRASGLALTRALNDSGVSGEGRFSRVGKGLIVGQIALSCLLLIGAGMTWRGLQARADFDIGFDAPVTSLLTARVAIFNEQFPTPAEKVRFFADIVDKLRADGDVLEATAAEVLPGQFSGGEDVMVEGQADPEATVDVYKGSVDDHFADTYGIKMLSGRFFDRRDQADSAAVVVVDQRFVDHYWRGQDPLNRRIKLDPKNPASPWATVVGVIRPLQMEDVDDDPEPSVLVPMRQSPVRFVSVAVRTRGEPLAFAPRLAEIVRDVNADTPVYWVRTFEQMMLLDATGDRFLALVFGIFGLVGLLLSAAGLYGVLAQSVARRTRELGVRRAIGAGTAQIAHHVAQDAGKLVVLGMLIGLSLGVPWAKMLSVNAFRMAVVDPLVFALVAMSILISATIAVAVPAWRAIRIDPMQALRYE